MLTVGGLLGIGVLAAALQTYLVPQLLTGGGRDGSTATPLLNVTQQSLVRMAIGVGSAGSVLLLAVLGVLGLVAVALLLLSRARIEFEGGRPLATGDDRGRPPMRIAVWVALAAFVGVVVWSLAPWLRHSFDGGPLPFRASTTSVLVHTWLPPLIGAIVSVTLAAMGGFAIGALRPLGRWSELLLLPFAPWLFVGAGPLAIDGFLRARDLNQLNTLIGLIPPGWVSIPALVAFTLLFRGQHARWQAGGGFARTLLGPALPMLLVAGLLTWLVNAQQLLWPQLIAGRPDLMPGPLLAASLNGRAFPNGESTTALGLVLPIPLLLLFLAAFVALQVTYLDRLAIRVGRPESDNAG